MKTIHNLHGVLNGESMYSTATIDNTDDKMIELVKNVYCQPTILEAFTPGNVFWLSKIIETSLPKNIASVLDIGCGTGGVLTFVQGRHPELRKAVGIDIAPKMIECAKLNHTDSRPIVYITDDV